MNIVLDFDGVIRNVDNNLPILGAENGILKLAGQGHKITVCTANSVTFAQDWLFKNMKRVVRESAIDSVTNTKPVADWYIDDKAIPFTSWETVEL
jgi:hypothetical protein